MDARARAEAALARAQARSSNIVTPASATSPMDSDTTQRLPRIVPDPDPDETVVIERNALG